MSSLLIKGIINLMFLVRWVLRLPCEITENSLLSSAMQLPSFLQTFNTGSHIHQRKGWHLFLFSLSCGRWVLMPPLGENCHPPSYPSSPGEKCQSCRAGIVLGFSYSDTWAWCFLAVRTQVCVLQLHRSTVWVRRCLQQVLPPETPPQLSYHKSLFLFGMCLFC